jgi:hypothetical protein
MRLLRTFMHAIGGYSGELPIEERTKNSGAIKRSFEPGQRLRAFFLECAAERFGIPLQSLQPDFPVEGGVRRRQATNLKTGSIGHRIAPSCCAGLTCLRIGASLVNPTARRSISAGRISQEP